MKNHTCKNPKQERGKISNKYEEGFIESITVTKPLTITGKNDVKDSAH